MMKQLLYIMVITLLASCGRNEPLSHYAPKSPQEQALKSVLLDFQAGVNALDAKKVENLIHEKALLMIRSQRTILTKKEYINILPERLAGNPSIALGRPKMTVSGDKAEVKIYMTRGKQTALVVFDMKLENGTWTIHGWTY